MYFNFNSSIASHRFNMMALFRKGCSGRPDIFEQKAFKSSVFLRSSQPRSSYPTPPNPHEPSSTFSSWKVYLSTSNLFESKFHTVE